MKIILDRINLDNDGKTVAVFEVEDKMIAFGEEQMPKGFVLDLIPNSIVECEIVDGCIISPVILYEETKQREEKMRNRLNRLAKRNR